MRIRLLFVGFSASVVLAAFGIQACGGSEASGPAADAGTDTTVTPIDSGVKDTGTDTGADAGCDYSADFTSKIPDASIADSGKSTGECVACTKVKCSTEVDKCNKDCACQDIADKGITCYAKSGGDIAQTIGCIGSLPKDFKTIQSLFGCINAECSTECATDRIDAGGN